MNAAFCPTLWVAVALDIALVGAGLAVNSA